MPEYISASTIEGLLIVEFVSFWSSSWKPFHNGSDLDKSNCVFLLQPQQIRRDRGIPHGQVWRSHGKIKEPRANVMAITWKLDLQAATWRRRYMDWTLWMFVWCSTVMGVLVALDSCAKDFLLQTRVTDCKHEMQSKMCLMCVIV